MAKERILPTAPAHAYRWRVFQPVRRGAIRRTGEWIETPWGRARVVGALDQRHADLHDACLFTALDVKITDAGRFALLCDPYRLRRALGGGKQQYSYEGMQKLFDGLMDAKVEWESSYISKNITIELKGKGHVIDDVEEPSIKVYNPRTGGERALLKVVLGSAWSRLIRDDIGRFYNPAAVAALDWGISQAVARFLLSHEPGCSYAVDEVLRHVAGELTSKQKRNARARLKSDAAGLATLGIEFDIESLTLRRPVNARREALGAG